MSRPVRISYQNAFYHITSRGHRKEKIFYDDKDKRTFLRKLEETFQKYTITCYAYCLMENHYHLFLKTTKPNISQAIHYLNTSYANWFGIRYQLAGSVFQGRFQSILIDADHDALVRSAYIHLNPFRAAIVDRLADYPWSSYPDFLHLRKSGIDHLDTSLVLHFFSTDDHCSIRQYRAYILLNQNLEDPFKQVYRSISLGDDDFIQKMKTTIKNQKSSREIPLTNSTNSYNPKEIIQKVCAVNQKEHERLVNKERGNIYRSLALYLTRNIPH